MKYPVMELMSRYSALAPEPETWATCHKALVCSAAGAARGLQGSDTSVNISLKSDNAVCTLQADLLNLDQCPNSHFSSPRVCIEIWSLVCSELVDANSGKAHIDGWLVWMNLESFAVLYKGVVKETDDDGERRMIDLSCELADLNTVFRPPWWPWRRGIFNFCISVASSVATCFEQCEAQNSRLRYHCISH